MTVVKGEARTELPRAYGMGFILLDGLHGDGMGLETTVDQTLIRGLATARP